MLPLCTICNHMLIDGVVATRCGHLYHETCINKYTNSPITPCTKQGVNELPRCSKHWCPSNIVSEGGLRRIYLNYDAMQSQQRQELCQLMEAIAKVQKELRTIQHLVVNGKCLKCGHKAKKPSKTRGKKRTADVVCYFVYSSHEKPKLDSKRKMYVCCKLCEGIVHHSVWVSHCGFLFHDECLQCFHSSCNSFCAGCAEVSGEQDHWKEHPVNNYRKIFLRRAAIDAENENHQVLLEMFEEVLELERKWRWEILFPDMSAYLRACCADGRPYEEEPF
uniref:RING-type domain-containing protein n=1 Tax=Anopheles maculatus TaxID=74869 RepID=A0A182SHX5_9DIPT